MVCICLGFNCLFNLWNACNVVPLRGSLLNDFPITTHNWMSQKVKLVLIHQPFTVFSVTCYSQLRYVITFCYRFNCLPTKVKHVVWTSYLGRSLPLIFCIHVRLGPTYWGVIYLAKKIIRRWYFTCKKPENILCDGILHV
jgi:hypothetical protein